MSWLEYFSIAFLFLTVIRLDWRIDQLEKRVKGGAT